MPSILGEDLVLGMRQDTIILCQAGLPVELSGVERFIAILGSTNEAPLDLLDYNKVLVLIHLIRWHAFIGYVLSFFNLEYQTALERMIPREQYTL